MAGRRQHLELEAPAAQAVAVAGPPVDVAAREPVVGGVVAVAARDVEPERRLVAGLERGPLRVGQVDAGAELRAQAGGAAGVVAVRVGEEDVTDAAGVVAERAHVGEDRRGVEPGPGVHERELVAAVDQVDVAVERVGDPDPGFAAADQGDLRA